jgi:hypothetical protein
MRWRRREPADADEPNELTVPPGQEARRGAFRYDAAGG